MANIIYFDNFGTEHIPKEIKKTYRKQKNQNKYLYNVSIQFDNVRILLHWIYWFYPER